MRNAAGAVNSCADTADELDDAILLREVVHGIEVIHGEASLLVDDGERIVDLVRHTGCEAADGGELLRVLHLREDGHAALIRRLEALHEELHEKEGGNDDKGHAEAENQQDVGLQRAHGPQNGLLGLDRHHHEIGAGNARVRSGPAGAVSSRKPAGRDGVAHGRQGQRTLFQKTAKIF